MWVTLKTVAFASLHRAAFAKLGNWVLRYEAANTESTCELQNVVVNFGATELRNFLSLSETGGGVLPYISHIGMCRPKG